MIRNLSSFIKSYDMGIALQANIPFLIHYKIPMLFKPHLAQVRLGHLFPIFSNFSKSSITQIRFISGVSLIDLPNMHCANLLSFMNAHIHCIK